MKRILSLLAVLLILFSLFGCGGKKEVNTIDISGANVPVGVYTYYLDKVMSDPKAYSVKKNDEASVKQAALAECKNYTALFSFLHNNGISIEYRLKNEVAENTENIWNLFSTYYEKIGVSKQDINKIMTYEAGKEQLVLTYYGEGGKKEVSEDDLKQKFVELYIGFKGFECKLTKENANGETVEMTEQEKQETETQLRQYADEIDKGADIDTVYAKYCKSRGLVATEALTVNITKENDPMYDDDFFSKMSTISHGRAAIVKTGSSIYVVQRSTIATSDEDAFAVYRTDVLNEMKMPAVEKLLSKVASGYTVTADENALDEIYQKLSSVKTPAKSETTTGKKTETTAK
ncbi:MAG: hypothetical protein ACI4XE_10225 [Acutalibacteraceae bacterium]